MTRLLTLAIAGFWFLSALPAHATLGECLPSTPKVNTSILRGAVFGGKLKIVKACLQMGIEQDTVAFTEAVETSILEAKLEILKTILDWDPTVVTRELKDSTFPLQLASRIYPGFSSLEKARYEALEIVLSHQPDVLAADDRGRTALHMAARACNPVVTEKLLALGADPNAVDQYLVTPLKQASIDCQVTMLLPHEESRLDRLSRDLTRALLDRGATADTQDNLGGTALHQLALRSRVDSVRLLIQAGADVNSENLSGCRPLDYAKASKRVSGGKSATIQLLKSSGAKPGSDCELGG